MFAFRSLPMALKIPLFPFWVLGLFISFVWVLLSGLAALAGTLVGQVARLLGVFLYFVWFYAYVGWSEGHDMSLRSKKLDKGE